ncbi:MAG: hypothetical protein WCN92_11510 [Eubacteriales bacterium]
MFKPITEESALKIIFGAEKGFIGYAAELDDVIVGKCLFKIENTLVSIYNLDFIQEESDIGEGLFRAALNFAANRNAYIARIEHFKGNEFVIKFGFTLNNGFYEAEIPCVLHNRCTGDCLILK